MQHLREAGGISGEHRRVSLASWYTQYGSELDYYGAVVAGKWRRRAPSTKQRRANSRQLQARSEPNKCAANHTQKKRQEKRTGEPGTEAFIIDWL